MVQGELYGRGGEADAMTFTRRTHGLCPLDDVRSRRRVVIGLVKVRVNQETAVEDSAHDHPYASLQASRKEKVGTSSVEECVPSGQEDTIEIDAFHEAAQHLGLVHSATNRSDDSRVA